MAFDLQETVSALRIIYPGRRSHVLPGNYFRREPRSADIGQVDQTLDQACHVSVVRGIAPPFIEIDGRTLLPRL